MRAPWVPVGFVALVGVSASAEASPHSSVTVIHAWGDPFAAETARHLADQLDRPTILKTSTTAMALTTLLPRAQKEWPDQLIVALDIAAHQVAVMRAQDGTLLSRALDPAQQSTPYAVALVALELLDLAAPEVRGTTTSSTSGPRWSIALDAGGVVSYAPSHEGAIWMPSFGAAVVLRSHSSAWWGSLGLTLRVLGDREGPLGPFDVDYDRWDAAVRIGLGRQDGRLETMLAAEFGGSYTVVSAVDATGVTVGMDERWAPSAAAILEARLRLAFGFALKASAGLGIVPSRARFLVQDDAALEEGAVRLLFGAGLLWELQ